LTPKLSSLLKNIETSDDVKEIINSKPLRPLFITIFKQANMYNSGYKELKASMDKSKELNFVAPMLMTLCFSIELLMKSYILLENNDITKYSELKNRGISIRGHKYSDLFGKIKQEYKDNILTELSAEMQIELISEETFKQILVAQNCDNSFAEWRYIFEQDAIKSINTQLLMNLNEVLVKQLFKLIKS
jgi:hypothetical protein